MNVNVQNGPAVNAPPTQPPEPTFVFKEVGPARLRTRHWFLIAAFILIVVLPTAFATWVTWNFAGSLRQVTASVTVQQQSLGVLGGASGEATLRSAFTGSGAEETAIVRQLVTSQDFYRTIRDQVDLSAVWPSDRLVPFLPPRYDAAGSVEKGHRYWRNMVSVNLGSRDRIIRLSVRAFEQQSAEALLQAIREEAERRLNLARTQTLRAARAEAERRLIELQTQDAADREALKDFRLQTRTIDPQLLATMNAGFKSYLLGMLANEEILIAEAEASVGESRALTRRPEDRITALRTYIQDPAAAQSGIASADDITEMMAEYQPLRTEAELSGMAVRLAELSILYYDRELESNKVFLTSVTGGNSAAIKLFPQFGPTMIVVFIGTFIVWCMVLLTFYGIRDRK